MNQNVQAEPEQPPEVEASAHDALVMPDSVVGYVSYDVRVRCPHCGKSLHLNQYPYNDDQNDYTPAEDELGAALFGSVNEPAQWDQLRIEYTCCGCKKPFAISTLVY